MDSLPPVENAQFSVPPTVVDNSPQPTSVQASRMSRKTLFLVASVVVGVVLIAVAVWAFSQGRSAPATNLTLNSNDQFTQENQETSDIIVPNAKGDVREDSPGFIGGRAEEGQTANAEGCTLDTQTCSDGSTVERQGPSCEFAACPSETLSPARSGWTVYNNSQYKYYLSVPSDWRVTEDGATVAASANSEVVLIFNPALPLGEDSSNGMTIEFSGPLMDTAALEQVTMNGVPMFRSAGQHGPTYFVNVPGTEDYLFITGADGDTPDEANNQMLREIFTTFRVR